MPAYNARTRPIQTWVVWVRQNYNFHIWMTNKEGSLPLGLTILERIVSVYFELYNAGRCPFFTVKCMFAKKKSFLRDLMFIVYHLQAYHSTLSAPNSLCKMALLPINTKFKGPAPPGCKTLSYCCIICKILSMACLSMFCVDQFSPFGSDHGIVCLVILKTYQANDKLLVNFSWK